MLKHHVPLPRCQRVVRAKIPSAVISAPQTSISLFEVSPRSLILHYILPFLPPSVPLHLFHVEYQSQWRTARSSKCGGGGQVINGGVCSLERRRRGSGLIGKFSGWQGLITSLTYHPETSSEGTQLVGEHDCLFMRVLSN